MTATTPPDKGNTLSLPEARRKLSLLKRVGGWLDAPMMALSGVWLYLMVVEYVSGLNRAGEWAINIIWAVFLLDFCLRLVLAPRKWRYIRRNWLTVLSLFVPALRILRFVRVFRGLAGLKSLQLVRVVGSVNRGMKALGKAMRRRGFGYVVALTVIVALAGAAGMHHFEKNLPNGELNDYWTSLWWTAMILTTMGSGYWPQSPEGRTLCLLLAIYAFSIFGYFTGFVATYFLGRDATDSSADVAGKQDIERLRHEIAELRRQLTDSGDG